MTMKGLNGGRAVTFDGDKVLDAATGAVLCTEPSRPKSEAKRATGGEGMSEDREVEKSEPPCPACGNIDQFENAGFGSGCSDPWHQSDEGEAAAHRAEERGRAPRETILRTSMLATLLDGTSMVLRAGTVLREREPSDRVDPGIARVALLEARSRLREIMPAKDKLPRCKHDAKAGDVAKAVMNLLDRALAVIDLR